MAEIKNRFTGKIIVGGEKTLRQLTEEKRANLHGADLCGADLYEADLCGADLYGANLYGADLRGADLHEADLCGANLYGADLRGADLRGADLYGADLHGANLYGADLHGADLHGANLYGANLCGAKIEFHKFPSIRLISSIYLNNLSVTLMLELMRRDAFAHPYPEKFDEWAKGGKCPYQNEERFWLFVEKRNLWRKGKPQMRDSDLIIEICKSQGWKIKGYLE